MARIKKEQNKSNHLVPKWGYVRQVFFENNDLLIFLSHKTRKNERTLHIPTVEPQSKKPLKFTVQRTGFRLYASIKSRLY